MTSAWLGSFLFVHTPHDLCILAQSALRVFGHLRHANSFASGVHELFPNAVSITRNVSRICPLLPQGLNASFTAPALTSLSSQSLIDPVPGAVVMKPEPGGPDAQIRQKLSKTVSLGLPDFNSVQ